MLSKARFLMKFGHKNISENSNKCLSLSSRLFSVQKTNKSLKETESKQSFQTSYETFIEPYPINGLDICNHIEKIEKNYSIFNNYVLGTFDKDLLIFPFVLKNRKEFLHIEKQYEMIRSSWININKDHNTLKSLGYYSLHEMSVSEMANVFEAIGASIQKRFAFGTQQDNELRNEKKMNRTLGIDNKEKRIQVHESAFESFNSARINLESIIPLLLHNSVIQYAVRASKNENLKNWLKENDCKIGFAMCEPEVEQSSNLLEWNTFAKLTYDKSSWVVSGKKNQVIAGDYDNYLVCCRTNDFIEKQEYNEKPDLGSFVMLLIPKDQLTFDDDYKDRFGVKYQTITMKDVKIDRLSSEVMEPTNHINEFLNMKGCGTLAVSALLLGMMKQLQKNSYAYLINDKLGLVNSEIVQYQFYQTTTMIYSIESMLYMTAAMYDSFERGAHLEGETAALKVLSTEYSYKVFQQLRSVFGSRYPFITTCLDLISSLDSLFETAFHTRVRIGQESIRTYQDNNHVDFKKRPLLPISIYDLKIYLKYRKLRRMEDYLTEEITKYVHHQFHPACRWLESCMNRLEYSTNALLSEHGPAMMEKQNDLYRISSIMIDIYKMICILSRANHSLCYGFKNNDAERELCLAILKDTFLKHLQLFENMSSEAMTDNDRYAESVFKANLKSNGYFASLFREKKGKNEMEKKISKNNFEHSVSQTELLSFNCSMKKDRKERVKAR